jgi:ABC-type glycerol-3-phosphate transport system permease component
VPLSAFETVPGDTPASAATSRMPGTVFFLPYVIGFAAASYLWLWLLDPSVGLLDHGLQALGLTDKPVLWMSTANRALFAVILMIVWKVVGFTMLLLMSGLQSIPNDVQEAAKVDGAGRMAAFRRITVQLMRRSIALVTILAVAGSILAFDQFYILTNGGPNTAIVSLGTVLGTLVLATLGGYGFARYRFRGSKRPVPRRAGDADGPVPGAADPAVLGPARAAPAELAARPDARLVPVAKPAVVTVALFAFFSAWNEFLAALILLSDNDKYTLPVLMTAVRAGRLGAINWGAVQAGVMVMTIPCLLIFLALQRYYMRGLMAGAVK